MDVILEIFSITYVLVVFIVLILLAVVLLIVRSKQNRIGGSVLNYSNVQPMGQPGPISTGCVYQPAPAKTSIAGFRKVIPGVVLMQQEQGQPQQHQQQQQQQFSYSPQGAATGPVNTEAPPPYANREQANVLLPAEIPHHGHAHTMETPFVAPPSKEFEALKSERSGHNYGSTSQNDECQDSNVTRNWENFH